MIGKIMCSFEKNEFGKKNIEFELIFFYKKTLSQKNEYFQWIFFQFSSDWRVTMLLPALGGSSGCCLRALEEAVFLRCYLSEALVLLNLDQSPKYHQGVCKQNLNLLHLITCQNISMTVGNSHCVLYSTTYSMWKNPHKSCRITYRSITIDNIKTFFPQKKKCKCISILHQFNL